MQSGGSLADNAATVARTTTSNVTAGNLVVVMCFRYADTDSTNFVAGDLVKSGTCTVTEQQLDAAINSNYNTTFYVGVGIWSARVTGTGSLTMTATTAAGNYAGLAIAEFSATSGWDSSRLEGTPATASTTSDNTNADTGNSSTAAGGVFCSVLATSNNGGAVTITQDAAFNLIFEEQDEDTHGVGSTMYQIAGGALTDSGSWTISNNLGWACANAVYKEITPSGGAAYNAVPLLHYYRSLRRGVFH